MLHSAVSIPVWTSEHNRFLLRISVTIMKSNHVLSNADMRVGESRVRAAMGQQMDRG